MYQNSKKPQAGGPICAIGQLRVRPSRVQVYSFGPLMEISCLNRLRAFSGAAGRGREPCRVLARRTTLPPFDEGSLSEDTVFAMNRTNESC